MQENSHFTLTGPLIWCDNLQVRLWMILNINYNVSHYMGMSQMCAGADPYFRSSKPHSRKLCIVTLAWKQEFSLPCEIFMSNHVVMTPTTPRSWKAAIELKQDRTVKNVLHAPLQLFPQKSPNYKLPTVNYWIRLKIEDWRQKMQIIDWHALI